MSTDSQPALPQGSQLNPAVLRCRQAWATARQEAAAHRKNSYEVREAANAGFRKAMPSLSGIENIQDFIACVADGMVFEVISSLEAPRLLYAAQVAVSAQRKLGGSAAKEK